MLLSFWLSTASFCILQIVFGPGGITETQRLERQKIQLDSRLAELQAENARLSARYESLLTSPEAVRLEARSLGYFEAGEVPVRTLGGVEFSLPPEDTHLSRIPPAASSSQASTLFFRLAWPLLFLVFWGALHLFPRLSSTPQPPRPSDEKLPAIRAAGHLPAPWFGLDFFRK